MIKIMRVCLFKSSALNPVSCYAYGLQHEGTKRAEVYIDVDGSGPLEPFPVTCEFFSKFLFVCIILVKELLNICSLFFSSQISFWYIKIFFLPDDGKVYSHLGHKHEMTTTVDGFERPGSYVQDIVYDANMDQIEIFVNRSTKCRQKLHYQCIKATLFNSPSPEHANFVVSNLNFSSDLIV